MPRLAETIYGAIVENENGKYRLDREKTQEKREEMRRERANEAVPVREWMETERRRVQNGDFIKPVRAMYRSSMAISQSWAKEFKEFWGLPDDFEMKE